MNLFKIKFIIGFCAISMSLGAFAFDYSDARELMYYVKEVKKRDDSTLVPLKNWLRSVAKKGNCDGDTIIAVIKSGLSFDDKASCLLSIKTSQRKCIIKDYAFLAKEVAVSTLMATVWFGGLRYFWHDLDSLFQG